MGRVAKFTAEKKKIYFIRVRPESPVTFRSKRPDLRWRFFFLVFILFFDCQYVTSVLASDWPLQVFICV